jgi:hypothetical protein
MRRLRVSGTRGRMRNIMMLFSKKLLNFISDSQSFILKVVSKRDFSTSVEMTKTPFCA